MQNIRFQSLNIHRNQNLAFLAALFFSFNGHLIISKLHGCTAPRCVLKLEVELKLQLELELKFQLKFKFELEFELKLKLELELKLQLEQTRTQTLC